MQHHQSSNNDKLLQLKRSGCSANDFNYNHSGAGECYAFSLY